MSGPNITRDDAVALFNFLKGRGFVKGRDIPEDVLTSRKVRGVCSEYAEHFVSTQAGYANASECSNDEIENAIADLRSRAAKIAARADALDRVLRARSQPSLV